MSACGLRLSRNISWKIAIEHTSVGLTHARPNKSAAVRFSLACCYNHQQFKLVECRFISSFMHMEKGTKVRVYLSTVHIATYPERAFCWSNCWGRDEKVYCHARIDGNTHMYAPLTHTNTVVLAQLMAWYWLKCILYNGWLSGRCGWLIGMWVT